MPQTTQTRAIALIRHGDYEQPADVPSALLPYGLTTKGADQARACVALINAFCRSHQLVVRPVLHCSRQVRAYQTATIIAAGLKDGGAGEDEVERAEKELEALTKSHTDRIDEALKNKEAELLEV